MSRELLNGARRRTTHRQVRAERVPQTMNAVLPDMCPPRGPFHVMLHDVR